MTLATSRKPIATCGVALEFTRDAKRLLACRLFTHDLHDHDHSVDCTLIRDLGIVFDFLHQVADLFSKCGLVDGHVASPRCSSDWARHATRLGTALVLPITHLRQTKSASAG
jgi:hypothetical protein